MATKQRNQYNNDRLMWLGAFAPGLRKRVRTPPFQAPEQLAKPSGYPGQNGDITVTMKAVPQTLMADQRMKWFVNGKKVVLPESPTWADLPEIQDGDRLTVWVYEEEELLPAIPDVALSIYPSLGGAPAAFPATISAVSYGYVNGLYLVSNTPVGNPVAAGATPLTFGVVFEYKTTKLLPYEGAELAQVVFSAEPATGKTTEFAFLFEVVMCKITARHQAVQHNGVAGGNFLVDGYRTNQIYSAVDPGVLQALIGRSTYKNFVDVSSVSTLLPTLQSQTYSSAGLSPAGSYTLSYTAPLMDPTLVLPTGTYPGIRSYFTALNGKLSGMPLQILTGAYGGPIPSGITPPGSLLTIPAYSGVGAKLITPFNFDPTYRPFGLPPFTYVRDLPIPDGYDPADTVYSEVVYYCESKQFLTSSVTDPIGSFNYVWPPRYMATLFNGTTQTYQGASNPGHGWDGGDPNVPNGVLGVSTILAPTYVLSQYVDSENPELSSETGRAVYIQLTTTVELSDAQYAALREAGVASLSDFEQFVADNPDVGEIQTETNFDLDLNTPQMQDLLGTNQLDEDKAQALFDLLSNGMTGTEDFLAAAGNAIDTKVYPPSPSAMDQLKMAGKVVSGVNSLLTLGKILANTAVLSTPLGILMAINTGINIYNATQAASGLANNQMPQYIPTVNETFFNAFRNLVSPTPPRTGSGFPVNFPQPKKIP